MGGVLMKKTKREYTRVRSERQPFAAENALLTRRAFLGRSVALAGAAVSGAAAAALPGRAAAAESVAAWQKVPGVPAGAYGQPSEFEKGVTRHVIRAYPE